MRPDSSTDCTVRVALGACPGRVAGTGAFHTAAVRCRIASRNQKPRPNLTPTPMKCVQCSLRIEPGDLVVFMRGDLFHLTCWRIVASNVRIEESAKLKRQSRDLIAKSQAKVRRTTTE